MKVSTRVLLTVLAVAVAAVAVLLLVVLPLGRRVESDRAAIQSRRAQLAKLERITRWISDLHGEIRRLEEALEFFENRLPEKREIDVIVREVWLIAEVKSLTSRSIRTEKSERMPRYSVQPVRLALEGRFEGFYEFLLGLERLPRITKVREMQIQKSPTQEGAVRADLVVDIFFEQ